MLPAGAGHDKSAWYRLLPLFSAPGNPAGSRRITLTTNATFATEEFLRRLRHGEHLLLIADEVHRAGSSRTLTALEQTKCGATLGLSATYFRQFDSRGDA